MRGFLPCKLPSHFSLTHALVPCPGCESYSQAGVFFLCPDIDLNLPGDVPRLLSKSLGLFFGRRTPTRQTTKHSEPSLVLCTIYVYVLNGFPLKHRAGREYGFGNLPVENPRLVASFETLCRITQTLNQAFSVTPPRLGNFHPPTPIPIGNSSLSPG